MGAVTRTDFGIHHETLPTDSHNTTHHPIAFASTMFITTLPHTSSSSSRRERLLLHGLDQNTCAPPLQTHRQHTRVLYLSWPSQAIDYITSIPLALTTNLPISTQSWLSSHLSCMTSTFCRPFSVINVGIREFGSHLLLFFVFVIGLVCNRSRRNEM